MKESEGPVAEKQRYLILDALRGFALMGIALANFPEFALWTFLSPEDQAAIGFCHLMFIWSGDILLLYAVGGMLLPLFFRLKDKVLLLIAGLLVILPVGLDALTEFAGVDFAGPFYDLWWREAHALGLTVHSLLSFGLVLVILTALAVLVLQTYLSRLWLSHFLFGPLEWIWRLLTYGHYIPLKK